jgi:hypothetical protein
MQGLLHICTTERNQSVGTNGRKGYQAHLTGVHCLFLPMSSYSAIQNGYTVGRTFDVFFDEGTDIQVNDRLSWNSGTYLVKGAELFAALPIVAHLKVTAVTENAHV